MRLPNVPARFATAGGIGGRVPGNPKQVDSQDAFRLFKAGTLAGVLTAKKGINKEVGIPFLYWGKMVNSCINDRSLSPTQESRGVTEGF
jgi:hypothetical protein